MYLSLRAVIGTLAIALLLAGPAEARITRIQIVKTEPAFGGMSFGAIGTL